MQEEVKKCVQIISLTGKLFFCCLLFVCLFVMIFCFFVFCLFASNQMTDR